VTSLPLRVLVVEDSENDTELLVHELRRTGRDVVWERVDTFGQMKAALEREPWDLVVSDYSMPHFSAPAALELLKETGLDLPFLVISGTVGEELAVQSMKAGAHDYLSKDSLTRLVPAVERELERAAERRAGRRAFTFPPTGPARSMGSWGESGAERESRTSRRSVSARMEHGSTSP
jgi:DNA-binding NtrC family response regulator